MKRWRVGDPVLLLAALGACGGGATASETDAGAADSIARMASHDATSTKDARRSQDARGGTDGGRDAASAPDTGSPEEASRSKVDAAPDAPRRDARADVEARDAGQRDVGADVEAPDAGRADAAADVSTPVADAAADASPAPCVVDCTVIAYCIDVPGGGYTLLWNGTSWAQTNTGPSPVREGPQMAALTDTVVLFGGSSVPSETSPTTYFDDTWVWSGGVWSEAEVPGPSARVSASFAALGSNLVLVGGSASPAASVDTWLWNGSVWSQLDVTGPSGRSAAAMAPLGGQLVLFGGSTNEAVLQDDTWTFDGTAWTSLEVTGPSARVHANMVPFGDKLLLFGGWGGAGSPSAYTDTWTWDGESWAEIATSGPPPSIVESLVPFNGGALLLSPDGGGWMWWFDGSTWTELAPTLPICGAGPTGFVSTATSF